jgi:hypothetical protein
LLTSPAVRWSPRIVIALVTGFAAGFAGMLGALALAGDSDQPEPAASTASTTTTTLIPEWFHPSEVVIGPAVLVPGSLGLWTGTVIFKYRLEPIAPSTVGPEDDVDTVVFPDRWTLLTENGEITTRSMPWSREASFRAPAGFRLDEIKGLRLDTYWLLTPARIPFLPSPTDFTSHTLAPGLTASLTRVQRQATGFVVAVELRSEDGVGTGNLSVEGVGRRWVASSADQTDTTRWSMSFSGEELPDPLPLEVRGVLWAPVRADTMIRLNKVPRGL